VPLKLATDKGTNDHLNQTVFCGFLISQHQTYVSEVNTAF